MSQLFREDPASLPEDWDGAVCGAVFSEPPGSVPVEHGLLVAALLRMVAGDYGLGIDEVWMKFVPWFSAAGPYPSSRFRALEALVAQEGEAALRALSTQPQVVGRSVVEFYGDEFADRAHLFDLYKDQYPERLQDESGCPCPDCNLPTWTCKFLDPRGGAGPHFEDFCEQEQLAFLALFPRWLLEWGLSAWRHEAELDELHAEGDDDNLEEYTRRRQLLIRRAEAVLAAEHAPVHDPVQAQA